MNAYHIAVGVAALAGCLNEPTLAAGPCADPQRAADCAQLRPDLQDVCYEDGVVGPAPYSIGLAWPEYDCAAGPGENLSTHIAPRWYNWWCCAAPTCTPGEARPCACPQGGAGRQFCDGTGARLGACVCN